jgi:hypothetical protein
MSDYLGTDVGMEQLSEAVGLCHRTTVPSTVQPAHLAGRQRVLHQFGAAAQMLRGLGARDEQHVLPHCAVRRETIAESLQCLLVCDLSRDELVPEARQKSQQSPELRRQRRHLDHLPQKNL